MEEIKKETGPAISEGKEAEDDRIQQKYLLLQQEWDDYIKTRTIDNNISNGSCSTDSRIIVKALEELLLQDHDNSPRTLMSSLQRSPWKVIRNNNMAVQEVLQERRAAIESGKLKGRRRLFEDKEEEMACSGLDGFVVEDSGSEGDEKEVVHLGFSYENCSDKSKKGFSHNESFLLSESPIPSSSHSHSHSPSSCSSFSSFVCDECLERQMVEEDEGEKVNESVNYGVGLDQERRRKIVVRVFFSFCLVLCVIGIISFNNFRGFYGGHNVKVTLVPT